MQLRASLVSLMLVVYSLRVVAVLPGEERLSVHTNRELRKERKEVFLKLLSGLLDGADSSEVLGGDVTPMDLKEPLESRLEERAIYNRLSQLPQRARKAPCKNFFWKTFTSC